MLAIKFRFLSDGYHAKSWGKNANDEAAAEWPPSPWRIVRAIAAVWKRHLPDLPESLVSPIIEKLASERPKFHLPRAAVARSTHYMPLGETRSGEKRAVEKTKLFFDIFAATPRCAPLYAIWDGAELDEKQSATLSALLAAMPCLGRAESWVEAGLASSAPAPNCMPLESIGAGERGGEWERTLVLAPSIIADPKRLLKSALAETAAILKSGKPIPEGVERVRYVRKRGIFNDEAERVGTSAERERAATVVRLSMTGETHQPSVIDTLRWGDAAHKAAVRMSKGASRALSGIDPQTNKPVSDPSHPHAFYLPADEDGDGKLDALTVWAPGGLSEDDIDALLRIKTLYTRRGENRIRLGYLSRGFENDFEEVSPLFRRAKKWESATPYIPTRHLPRRGRYSVKKPAGWRMQARREIERRGGGWDLASVDFGRDSDDRAFAARFFKHRANGARVNAAMKLNLEFAEPVRGPVAFGYACHFGMGLFVPAS